MQNLSTTMAKNNTVLINGKKIGDQNKIYIIGDIGLTNGGDIERTFKLIDTLADLEVDAIKLQMIGPDELLGDKKATYEFKTLLNGEITQNMYEMFSELNFSDEEWFKISDYIFSKKIEFICTSHFMGAVDLLEKCKVNLHKICTWSSTHKRLIEKIGKTKKPLLIDTGASTIEEIEEIFVWHSRCGGKEKLILHDFHTDNIGEMNFKGIQLLKETFNCPVGYTPQGRDYDYDLMCVGIGANILEKRITLDRKIPKNGHWKALEPKEFKLWLDKIRDCEKAMGDYKVIPSAKDIEISKWAFKSLYSSRNISRGETAKDDMFVARRPGTGISPKKINDFIGKKFSLDVKEGTLLKQNYFE